MQTKTKINIYIKCIQTYIQPTYEYVMVMAGMNTQYFNLTGIVKYSRKTCNNKMRRSDGGQLYQCVYRFYYTCIVSEHKKKTSLAEMQACASRCKTVMTSIYF